MNVRLRSEGEGWIDCARRLHRENAGLRARLEGAEAALALLEDEFGATGPEQAQTAIRLLRAAGVVRRTSLESAEAALAVLEDEFGSHRPEQVQTAIRLLRAAGVVRRDERSE